MIRWERADEQGITFAAVVPGGRLYRFGSYSGADFVSSSIAFVPDAPEPPSPAPGAEFDLVLVLDEVGAPEARNGDPLDRVRALAEERDAHRVAADTSAHAERGAWDALNAIGDLLGVERGSILASSFPIRVQEAISRARFDRDTARRERDEESAAWAVASAERDRYRLIVEALRNRAATKGDRDLALAIDVLVEAEL